MIRTAHKFLRRKILVNQDHGVGALREPELVEHGAGDRARGYEVVGPAIDAGDECAVTIDVDAARREREHIRVSGAKLERD